MKRIVAIVLLAGMAAGLCGCSGVILSSQYSRLLDETAAISTETANRAEAGALSAAEMAAALRKQSAVWQQFRSARDGKAVAQ